MFFLACLFVFDCFVDFFLFVCGWFVWFFWLSFSVLVCCDFPCVHAIFLV